MARSFIDSESEAAPVEDDDDDDADDRVNLKFLFLKRWSREPSSSSLSSFSVFLEAIYKEQREKERNEIKKNGNAEEISLTWAHNLICGMQATPVRAIRADPCS